MFLKLNRVLLANVLAFYVLVNVSFGEPAKVPSNAKPTAENVSLEIVSWEQTQEIIASYKGKIVVLDVWSTSCVPCLRELPELVKLQHKFPRDVVCVSLNANYIGLDSPKEEREAVLEFLTKQKANLRNLLSSDDDEKLYKKIGIASIPVAQVYDRAGKLVKQFDNEKQAYGEEGFTYAKHIEPYVKSLVEKK